MESTVHGPIAKDPHQHPPALEKKTPAQIIVEEDIQPQSRAERTRSLILAAVRVWELKRGIRG